MNQFNNYCVSVIYGCMAVLAGFFTGSLIVVCVKGIFE